MQPSSSRYWRLHCAQLFPSQLFQQTSRRHHSAIGNDNDFCILIIAAKVTHRQALNVMFQRHLFACWYGYAFCGNMKISRRLSEISLAMKLWFDRRERLFGHVLIVVFGGKCYLKSWHNSLWNNYLKFPRNQLSIVVFEFHTTWGLGCGSSLIRIDWYKSYSIRRFTFNRSELN